VHTPFTKAHLPVQGESITILNLNICIKSLPPEGSKLATHGHNKVFGEGDDKLVVL